jgi:hypothetical protein
MAKYEQVEYKRFWRWCTAFRIIGFLEFVQYLESQTMDKAQKPNSKCKYEQV